MRSVLRSARSRGKYRALVTAPWAPERGSVSFSEAALTQMVLHCVKDHDARVEVLRVSLLEDGGMAVLELSLRIPGEGVSSGGLHELREAVLHGMERAAGIMLREVRLTVDSLDFSGPGA